MAISFKLSCSMWMRRNRGTVWNRVSESSDVGAFMKMHRAGLKRLPDQATFSLFCIEEQAAQFLGNTPGVCPFGVVEHRDVNSLLWKTDYIRRKAADATRMLELDAIADAALKPSVAVVA